MRVPPRLLGFVLATSSVTGACLSACGGSDEGAAADAAPDVAVRRHTDAGATTADATITDAGAGARADAAADAGDAGPPLHHPFALTGIIATGQSLSVGVDGNPVIDVTQPYHNVRLQDDGSAPLYDGVGDNLSLDPLISPVRPENDGVETVAYPTNISGETLNEPAANETSALCLAADAGDCPIALSVCGEGGQVLSVIDKGGAGNSYASSLYEVTAIAALAKDAGTTFGVGAVFLTHGESDSANPDYESGLVTLQSNYQADVQAITGQTDPILIFHTQQSSFPPDSTISALSTVAQWQVAVDHPEAFVLVGPKYQYEYAGDAVHLTTGGYVAAGEKYGEAYFTQIMRQTRWRPLAPVNVTLVGVTLRVSLDVAFPPLAFDATLSANHGAGTQHPAWANGQGFEVTDSTGELTIQSAAFDGNDVVLTLAAPPTGSGLTVGYALFQDTPGAYAGGTLGGRHGAVRDSDPFVGRDRETLSCTVAQGTTSITAGDAGALPFANRTVHDRVFDAAGAEYVVTSRAADGSSLVISPPWAGASGTTTLTIEHEERNYLVEFSLPVP